MIHKWWMFCSYVSLQADVFIRCIEADLHLEPFLETLKKKSRQKKMDQVLSVHLEPPNQSTLRTKSRFSNFIIFLKNT